MKNKLKETLKISLMIYTFLGICNWNYNIANWNGFSHFLAACSVLVILSVVFDYKIID